MTEAQFLELVSGGERHGVEFKGPRVLSNKNQLHEVIRAALGMANRRDGGLVVVGVDSAGEPVGLDAAQRQSWSNRDLVRSAISPYADPHIELDVIPVQVASLAPPGGRHFVVLKVAQFSDVPVLCGKEGREPRGNLILRLGALYVRSREVEATVEISTQAQMRELIDLAVERGLESFVARGTRVGLNFGGQSASDKFAAQRKDAFVW